MKMRKLLKRFVLDFFHKQYIERTWKKMYGRKINWESPRDINEKIQWLMIYSDTSLWTLCSDKVKVREFVKERIGEEFLVKQYGVWNNADEINFDQLPNKFVLKCNHDSGSTFVLDKTKGFDKNLITKDLNKRLKINYGYEHGEMYYNGIKPLIVAEEFLEQGDSAFTSLVDYKIWCFDGKPFSIWTCYNRTKESTYVNLFDLDWNVHPEVSIFNKHYRDGGGKVPRPRKLQEMLNAASKLSKGFPEVRVDFYIVNDKIYFGELTFASLCGYMDFFTQDYLNELGDQIKLPPAVR